MKYLVKLVGDPGSEELKVSQNELFEKIKKLKTIQTEIEVEGVGDDIVRIRCNEFAAEALKDEWYVVLIEEEAIFYPT